MVCRHAGTAAGQIQGARVKTTESIVPVEAAMPQGAVRRGVVVDGAARALSRPVPPAVAPTMAPVRERVADKERAAERPAPAQVTVRPPVPSSSVAPQPAKVDDAASYQERGRGFQAGYDEGRQQGHAHGHADGFKEGQAKGHEEGFQAGLAQGREAAQQEAGRASEAVRQALSERVNRLDDLLKALARQMDQRMADAEEDMLALCFEAVVRIVGQAAASPEGVRGIVQQALVEARSKEAATVRVNPRDLAFLEADEELKAWLGASQRVQWVGDPRIEAGGCLVAAPEGGLDARLETQLARLAAVFSSIRQGRAAP